MKKKNNQIEMPGLGALAFKKSEDYLQPKGKNEFTTPLFNQAADNPQQTKLLFKNCAECGTPVLIDGIDLFSIAPVRCVECSLKTERKD